MSKVNKYCKLYRELLQMSQRDQESPKGDILYDKLDRAWAKLTPEEREKINKTENRAI